MATVKFFGAVQEVTGSCHMLQSSAFGCVLLDCGLHQGGDRDKDEMASRFPFSPHQVDAVILSHAHLDHSGRLPKLVHEGFDGPIFCTPATADLLPVMLLDALGLYERDIEWENRRRLRRGDQPVSPSYTRADVEAALKLCHPIDYDSPFDFNDGLQITLFDAGHILGSAIVSVQFNEKGKTKKLVFSGDLGKSDTVLMRDPTVVKEANVVLMEGTYGDRDHRSLDDSFEQLEHILHEAWQRGGNVLIPAFAVGRSQELLHYLARLETQGKLDNWHIFLDSPMAIEVTKVFNKWLSLLEPEDLDASANDGHEIGSAIRHKLKFTVTPEESMAINTIRKGAIIIAGSGMCTGGRIQHHFKQRIWDNRNTVLFVGFQAKGTLGRAIVDGATHIRLFKEQFIVKAQIETVGGFSAHAGQSELIDWAGNFTSHPQMILVHGEADALDTLSEQLWDKHQIDAEIPFRGQTLTF
ncbi:MBL fold metallo-hydrolase RNA specificity domain-containing protein [Aestuariibacter salexigens]|uniref:MBL fold metallo-hydrolase RNA specificity domain-containing protein n=1 Tax=Aestuariibacter salexigens TaxID=226010 RepID=UPI0003FC6B68|nr:MBL fold metallo-hydrolase [Aestuariibacter salexigens]